MAAFKMPDFDPERVERFFDEADDRFLALGIYHHSLKYTAITPFLPAQMLEAVVTRHSDMARSTDRYEALRAAVIEYSFRPAWARHHTIDNLPSVSSSLSPSKLMLRIIALKGTGHPYCDAYHYQFLKRLPGPLFEKFKDKPWEESDPMKFAHLVERSWSQHMAGPAYASIPMPGSHNSTNAGATAPSSSTSNGTGNPTVAQVTEERETASEPQDVLDVLRPLVAAIQAGRRGGTSNRRGSWRGSRGQGRGGGGNRQSNFNQPQQNQAAQGRSNNNDWCYFHQRFGTAATNCRPPCAYNQRTTGNVRTLQHFDYQN